MSDDEAGPERDHLPAEQVESGVVDNPWRKLRAFTDARIGLGRAGISLPTHRMLEFQLAHAQARDAVHLPLDVDALCESLDEPPSPLPNQAPIRLHSRADDRITYLQRPDLGRRLNDDSAATLAEAAADDGYDLALVIVDGLSSFGVASHAAPFIEKLASELADDADFDWSLAPLTVIEQGRVAIGDDVGERLAARCVVVLVGERPGLSSPDSLGLYLTWNPHVGVTDADRNCISNVRPAGLALDEAAQRLLYLLKEARRGEQSGVALKDRSGGEAIENETEQKNFLTG
ncbi:ethanolamine ammonia-lyase subunit EutC [Salinisphaera sp. Q1T1-3]|uniref:ethanolamine ammonia-lyase subunit EutC n=1 Tax=Salinisphaera sp. Q1T1-3 TaxID=2321229 RepID=UPI000E73FB2D|nr:ethanolamine ammonia-lyase subunit EutC [Salinisphaera sp. Q1T1-3]RJS91859.1 ethanolamine ammonia-lyase subunit EutC [Salinisphaera sp. Q1T1-3]